MKVIKKPLASRDSINVMYKRKLLLFMYKVHNSELPKDTIKLFDIISCHGYNLRNSIKYNVPRFNLDIGLVELH